MSLVLPASALLESLFLWVLIPGRYLEKAGVPLGVGFIHDDALASPFSRRSGSAGACSAC